MLEAPERFKELFRFFERLVTRHERRSAGPTLSIL